MRLPFRGHAIEPEVLSPIAKKIRRRKIKEEKKPWGKLERIIVLVFFLGTTFVSGILALKAGNKISFSVPKVTLPKVKGESTIIIENNKASDLGEKVNKTKSDINSATRELSGSYGVWAEDVNGTYSLGIMEHTQFEGASLFKLPLLVAVYKEIEKGNIDASMYEDTLIRLTKNSDNGAFMTLFNLVGQKKIDDVIAEVGMNDTDMSESLTSPYDIGLLLKKLNSGKLVSSSSANTIFDLLTNTDFEFLIPQGIPDVRVAHKYGGVDGVLNDAGIVFSGKPFILVIMSKDIDQTEALNVIPKISSIVYTGLK